MTDKPVTSASDIAAWMLQELEREHSLYQLTAAEGIRSRFGNSYVRETNSGGYAIDPLVLAEFRKLTKHRVIWESSGKFWRLRVSTDHHGQRRAN